MKSFTALSAAEQVAEHLRMEMQRGSLSGSMPGVIPLVAELGVNHKTVKSALRMLEDEGLLLNQGRGHQRLITLSENYAPPALRVGLLGFSAGSRRWSFMVELRHLLEEAGQAPFHPDKGLLDLGMKVSRVAQLVEQTEADAWVVCGGSQDILKWFSEQETPAFALFGRMEGLPLAGTKPDKRSSLAAATHCLLGHGHRRISLLCRSSHRLPKSSRLMRTFLDELEAGGIATGAFNLPDWEESPEGLERCFESLFGGLTPPTALILDQTILYHSAHHYLAHRGLRVPGDVSLVCIDGDPDFDWCRPAVAHIQWNSGPGIRRIVRWANDVRRNKDDRRQSLTKAEFIDGETIGPAPRER
jgi:DNA-binding LacI/PurR family transcriptional regulator